MILIIDNYDSFTHNLYQLVGEVLKDLNNSHPELNNIKVIRNDEMSLSEINELQPDRIIISPGPGNPKNEGDFGVCSSVIMELGEKIPTLGVCLGHQGIFSTFGGEIIHEKPVHGKRSHITHDGKGIFKGVSNPLLVARYHSLICDPKTTPDCLESNAEYQNNIIMAIKHIKYPIQGLQFHPESIGTDDGYKIIKNFLVNEYELH
ncbi:anthranilate synthase component II [Methanobacterium alcaliphilum]|uniref:anthranilate synthase component II n=1 Tax=Methanobacterium alcaliphilum TaxID=392018 RepID=UPI00200B7B1C|nr:aminodeoxychorismate/anthranilate synthase component II [Methanobacterium alcaliphilum]MCK9152600.1 aminodeoxychorismate/anthranilate synthase component II [Methanobacterium alcaliphilum]